MRNLLSQFMAQAEDAFWSVAGNLNLALGSIYGFPYVDSFVLAKRQYGYQLFYEFFGWRPLTSYLKRRDITLLISNKFCQLALAKISISPQRCQEIRKRTHYG